MRNSFGLRLQQNLGIFLRCTLNTCCRDRSSDLLLASVVVPVIEPPCGWYWTVLFFLPHSTSALNLCTCFLSFLQSSSSSFLFRLISLSSRIFAASYSLNVGQSVPRCHLFSVSLSVSVPPAPMLSAGIKTPSKPHLPCEWISYTGFKETSLLSAPWWLSHNTMSLFVLSLISPVREPQRQREAGRRNRGWRRLR